MISKQSSAFRILNGKLEANIYSLESRTSSKFFVPEFFSCFAQGFNYFFFCHIRERMFSLRYKFTQFTEMLLCFFNIWFWHNYYLFICDIPQQRKDVKCHKCHSRILLAGIQKCRGIACNVPLVAAEPAPNLIRGFSLRSLKISLRNRKEW